jgi:succinate-acetate transporter protein
MATDPRYERAGAGVGAPRDGAAGNGHDRRFEELVTAEDHAGWVSRSRVFLTPIAAPSIMGLFGFMIATLMLGAWQAGWYGTAATPLLIFPFAMVAGGLLQSIAAIASFRARDGVAVAMHTAWGSFWLAWGLYMLLVATHVLPVIPLGAASPSFAFWFIALTLVTIFGVLGALAQNMGLVVTLGTLAAGSALTAAGFWAGSVGTLRAGGWLFVVAAMAAWLTAGAMVLEHSFGRTIIPLGKWSKKGNIPLARTTDPIEYPAGMPGVRGGQ